ncbi:MAG: alpha-galactosidase [Lachnospiraceae bacterium]|nr:alpha-galactosidase [Lachnospiraceae bacterium]
MGIQFDAQQKIFHLQTKKTSYLMQVVKGKYLVHLYWGKKMETPLHPANALVMENTAFGANPNRDDKSYTLDYTPQEYPTGCSTDYRIPAISVLYDDGSRVMDLAYVDYQIVAGKPALEGLPATYMEDDSEGATLYITLRDKLKGVDVILSYTVFDEFDAITRSVKVVNQGQEHLLLERVASASVDFETMDYDFMSFPGSWGRERHIERTSLRSGIQSVESRRGASSHQNNPFIVLAGKKTDEEHGDVYGFNFVYSGNFVAGAEVSHMYTTRAYMGMNDYDFAWNLYQGESFQAPEVVMVYSAEGLGGMSRTYHRLYRKRLVRGKYRDEARPILVNNWEGTYFDFDEEKIVSLAKEAANLGIELLVLDDGWFGVRNDDRTSLGDWFVNNEKLPSGLKGLGDRIHACGINFGLWFEPEMVSTISQLYEKHPDWCIATQGRARTECRNQLTLDLSRDEVCEYIISAVNSILDNAPINYVKWDMNRHFSEVGSLKLPAHRQKEMPHRYMLGLYRVMKEITEAHPDVLFESCSGGGGRFDPGILYYMPQTWTSDDTDAVERLFIQYGTSMAYPISAMGAHVSAVPNHQAGRVTSLKMRGDVAMSGNFGYELDLMTFTEAEKEEVKRQVTQYKELREFVPSADMYRLQSPFEGNVTAWMFLSEDKADVFAAYFQIKGMVNPGISRMKFTALEPDAFYKDVESGQIYRGDELMNIGIRVRFYGDFQSKTWYLRKSM